MSAMSRLTSRLCLWLERRRVLLTQKLFYCTCPRCSRADSGGGGRPSPSRASLTPSTQLWDRYSTAWQAAAARGDRAGLARRRADGAAAARTARLPEIARDDP